MRWYPEIRAAVKRCMPVLLPTPGVNLALLARANLLKRTLCQTELARTFPRPVARRVAEPKHDLLHRVKRLSRFLDNDRVDPLKVRSIRGGQPGQLVSVPAHKRPGFRAGAELARSVAGK